MTWFADSDNQTESAKSHNLLVVAIDADFPDGHVRLSTFPGPLTINGNSYVGAGNLGKISLDTETTQLLATTRTYQLSGVDPALVPETEIDNCFGRSFTEYLVWLNAETRKVIGFEVNFEGRMDKVARRDGAEPLIELSVEHRLVILDRSDGWCYTDEHQKQFFSGDNGLDQVRANGSVYITWGGGTVMSGAPDSPNGGGGRGGGGGFKK